METPGDLQMKPSEDQWRPLMETSGDLRIPLETPNGDPLRLSMKPSKDQWRPPVETSGNLYRPSNGDP